jgi:hypothetical protein
MVRGVYDPFTQKAHTELMWFVRTEDAACWRQHRSVVEQRCYTQSEILQALRRTGFQDVQVFTSAEAGITSDLGFGRLFFVASCLSSAAA